MFCMQTKLELLYTTFFFQKIYFFHFGNVNEHQESVTPRKAENGKSPHTYKTQAMPMISKKGDRMS